MSPSRQLQKVYVSGFLFNVSYLLFAVLIPFYAISLHLAIWMVGILTALPGVLQLPTRIISGPLVDWLGERWVL
jgi:MFS family permease